MRSKEQSGAGSDPIDDLSPARHASRVTRDAAKPLQVAAALIARDGRYLICRRRPGAHLGGLWEFPGGKREGGESLEDCLVREIREELGVDVSAPVLHAVLTHAYPERRVELHFFRCAIMRGEPECLGCAELRWVAPRDLHGYEFPPADRSVIQRLGDEEPPT